ncbi:anthocyanidin 3-O-glucosyltransferase 2-like [Alnus glutinosa]|uniref:anthocyanidin 3-O-glucosyltransferase 2-like n=1 Tax=Alnus glutinosa TaxID=3517 RepID=UPI002D7A221F|nr:anthocyanidin 3-O-glucosyltransferase 2-like [Alnus glutinosa]
MRRAELVFIPTPAVGHLVSIIEFANLLLGRDDRFSITLLVINPPFAAATFDAYIQSIAASHTRIKCIHLPLVDPPPQELFRSSVEKYVADFIDSHKAHVKEAITSSVLSDSIPLAGLVVDMFCTAMIDVGHELGVPSYVFFTNNAACLGFSLYLLTRHDQVGIEFSESHPESVIPSYINPVPSSVLPSFVFHKQGYISMVNQGRKLKEAKGIIVNTFHELESHAFRSFLDDGIPPVYAVGPLINLKGQTNSEANQAEHDKIRKWLDDQPPSSVVFLCFGSMGSFGAPQLKETALALERSGHRFLWSVRLASPPGNDKIATPSDCQNLEEVLPAGFLERTREIGLICGWAPQVEVLAHKAIGGFVSHCGWNSILESLWHGVPIAAWPIYAEQKINTFQMVRDLGLAVELKLDCRRSDELVVAEEIEKAVKCLMDGESDVRKRVKEMSGKSRKAVVNGGSSFASLGLLIETMLGNDFAQTE